MKHYLLGASLLFFSCNNEGANVEKTNIPKVTSAAQASVQKEKEPAAADADLSAATVAVLDMGNYIFRVHEVIRFEPDEMQSKMMKWNNAEKDYYIIDGSIENKTNEILDTGRDMLAAYFTLNDGNVFKNILRGASILASYQVMYKKKYPQQQYDMIWKSKFPANGKARAQVFGLEVPKGTTIKGIGFYQKNTAKNKYADFN